MLMNPRTASSGQKLQHEKTLSVVFNHRRFERSSGAGVLNCVKMEQQTERRVERLGEKKTQTRKANRTRYRYY